MNGKAPTSRHTPNLRAIRVSLVQAMNVAPNLKAKVRDLPNKPGVYLMRDKLGRVIYVGKARSLRKRVSQYFPPSRRLQFDPKTRALIDSIANFETFVV